MSTTGSSALGGADDDKFNLMELAQRRHQVYRILFPEWKERTCKSDPRFGNADGASTVSRTLRGEDLCGCTRLPSPVAIYDLGLPAERATLGSLGPNSLSVHQTVRSMSMPGSLLPLDQTSRATLPFSRVRMD